MATRKATPARHRLDRETILDAARTLAGTPGVSTISFRDLGAELGVDPTAVYRHFRNKEELMAALLDDLADRAMQHVTADPAAWRDRLRELATGTLTEFERYPAIGVEAIVLTTGGPAEHRAIEFMLDAFTRAGLTGDELVRHYAVLAAHVLSTAANIARVRAQRADADHTQTTWLDGPVLVDPREFPLIAANSVPLAELRDVEMFQAGVEMILDSAQRAGSAG
ncbi:TetR/AcrR family transcriptional regulator [Microbacterium fluvii]|uniref:TetR/AcrR family transcriptional regulator n=1 Tax=Microbacterium fluvii TaxID=415215 RepID=A0ABW2H8I3_9MICO|nr:TetR/AcrR family transcriptional regulator [Microbacterium fluvii]MCU4671035.1 TetR/AcrR family transcriptional regulator [Microbacterium fluvii]